jgi:hypothetical protein
MQTIANQRQFNQSAKQAGFMPTYWSLIQISNDRTPEHISGSMEGRVS